MCLLHTRCPNVLIHISTDASTPSTAGATFHPRFATGTAQRVTSHLTVTSPCAFGATSIHITWTPVYHLLLSSQYHVDADVDQALIPPSIFAPEGTHGCYSTWQLMMLEEVFWLLKTCTGGYLLMKAQQSQFIWCFTHCTCVRAY